MEKTPARVLVIDDDADVLHTARVVLKPEFSSITVESNPEQINYLIGKNNYHVILLDMNYTAGATSGKEGLFWLKNILQKNTGQQVVMMTAYGDIKLAVEAMKTGAADFIVKPWENEKLVATIHAAYQHSLAKEEILQLKQQKTNISRLLSLPTGEIMGESEAMKDVLHTVKKIAATDANVLLLGENGTGKEMIARLLHTNSARKNEPFVKVDLGAVTETLFESELFGHVKGAFTDAKENKTGRLILAGEGTLFLDEIGNLSMPMQAKLLSVLQNREVTPVGSNSAQPLNARIIAATNRSLSDMVDSQLFREDLLYRLNTVEVLLPPLRNRGGDVKVLAQYFLQQFTSKYRKNLSLTNSTLEYLSNYKWPGNVRELMHAIERAVIMAENEVLSKDDFLLKSTLTGFAAAKTLSLDELEKQTIVKAIDKFKGNISKAAKELGLGRTTIYRKMEKYDIKY